MSLAEQQLVAVDGLAVHVPVSSSSAAASLTFRVATESEYLKVLYDAGFSALVAMDYPTFCKTLDKDLPVRTSTRFSCPDVLFCLWCLFVLQSIGLNCMTMIVNHLSLRRLKNLRVRGASNRDLWFNDENMDGAHASIIMKIPAPRNTKRGIKSCADVEVPWRRMVAIYCGYTRAIVIGLEDSQYRRCVRRPAGNALVVQSVCM